MTDLVFEAVLGQEKPPMMVASSSVHAVDGLYSFNDEDSVYWPMADRNFDAVNPWPERISAKTPAHAPNDYAREKEYAEQWCQKMADRGHSAVAARWGGINEHNAVVEVTERGYFSVWCHQEDAARFVHACYESYLNGSLPSGAHYFCHLRQRLQYFRHRDPAHRNRIPTRAQLRGLLQVDAIQSTP